MPLQQMECCGSNGTRHKKDCPANAPVVAPDAANLPEGSENASNEKAAPEPSVEPLDVAEELAAHESGTATASDKPVAAMSAVKGLDLSIFSPEQLAALRDALEAQTGKPSQRGKKRPTHIELRSIDDMLILGFSKALKKSVFDEEQQKNVVRTYIRVTLEGEEKPREISYKEFNDAVRVKTELVGVEESKEDVLRGEHWSEWKQEFIPEIVTFTRRIMSLKLPDGRILKIDSERVS